MYVDKINGKPGAWDKGQGQADGGSTQERPEIDPGKTADYGMPRRVILTAPQALCLFPFQGLTEDIVCKNNIYKGREFRYQITYEKKL